jgi:uncharacterized protein (TIGR02246 family)
MRKSLLCLGLAASCLLCIRSDSSGDGPARAESTEQAIRDATAAFADAFNKGDMPAFSANWAPDAEYIDEAGTVTKGRDAIAKLFKGYLDAHKGARLTLKVTSIQPLSKDVARQDGTSALRESGGTIDEGRYTAIWIKIDGKWRLCSARDLPSDSGDAGGSSPLKELKWLVGDWEAEKGGFNVSVHWTLNQAFLSVDYKAKAGDLEMTVMQLIGFDPLSGQIKTWNFDSLGGYSESLVRREGNTWTAAVAGVLPDGQTGTAVNVIRYVDDNTFIFQARDREVGGMPIPNSELKATRKVAK